MADTIRIPKYFYDDHRDRFEADGYEVAGPPIRQTKRHYYIDATDSLALRFLVWDCEYYDDPPSFCPSGHRRCYSARATHRAIKKALGWNPNEDLPRPPGQDFEDLQRGGRRDD